MKVTETLTEEARPLRADARRNRERILESARHVFAERGAEAQIDDVARRACVGVGTVYRHFPTKEALMVELVREQFRLFAGRAREALESDQEPFEALVDVLRRNAETTAGDAAVRYAITGVDENIWTQAGTEIQALIALTDELMARARKQGTIDPDMRGTDIAMLMCGVCSTMGRTGPGFDWRRHLEFLIDTLRPR